MKFVNHSSRPIYIGAYRPDDRGYSLTLMALGLRLRIDGNGTSKEWTPPKGMKKVQVIAWDAAVGGSPLAGPRIQFVDATSYAEDSNGAYLYNHDGSPGAMDKIEHVFVLMLENRSFDNILGWLYADKDNRPPRNIPEADTPTFNGLVEKAYWNTKTAADHNDGSAERFYATKASSMTKPDPNPPEICPRFVEQMFGTDEPAAKDEPNMWGFVQAYAQLEDNEDLQGVMECHTEDHVPHLSKLAKDYAVCDHWFGPLPCETFPSRAFLQAGTSFGRLNNMDGKWNEGDYDQFPDVAPNFTAYAGKRTIFDVLEEQGVPYGLYTDSKTALFTQLGYQFFTIPQKLMRPFRVVDQHLARDLDPKKPTPLPWYIFIEPEFLLGANDQHPPQDVTRADDLIHKIYTIISQSPVWHKSALIITYDEHGGCFDHVPPPTAVAPDDSKAQFSVGKLDPFTRFGPRVPTVVVSPYVEAGTVFRSPGVPHDHTSILASLRDWIFGSRKVTAKEFLNSKRVEQAPTIWNVFTKAVASKPTALPRDRVVTYADNIDSQPATLEQLAYVAAARALEQLDVGDGHDEKELEEAYAKTVTEEMQRLMEESKDCTSLASA